MSGEKYIGLDVHQATICAAVMDPMGKVIIESILETGRLGFTICSNRWSSSPDCAELCR